MSIMKKKKFLSILKIREIYRQLHLASGNFLPFPGLAVGDLNKELKK